MDEIEVQDIYLFTKLLDGGYTAKCCCGFIWRIVEDKYCPNCGRGAHHSAAVSEEEYRASRDTTSIEKKLKPSAALKRQIAQNPTPLRERFSSSS